MLNQLMYLLAIQNNLDKEILYTYKTPFSRVTIRAELHRRLDIEYHKTCKSGPPTVQHITHKRELDNILKIYKCK